MKFRPFGRGGGLASAAAALMHAEADPKDLADAGNALGEMGAGRAEANREDRGHVAVDPPAAGANADPAASEEDDDKKKKDGEEEKGTAAADPAAARAEGFAAGTARCLTVIQSEHFAGREPLAAELLGTDMAADKIVGALAKASKGGTDPMLGNLSQQQNPQLGAGKEAGGGKADAKAAWDRTMANLGFVKKD